FGGAAWGLAALGLAALGGAALVCAVPAFAQAPPPADPAARADAFSRLPYWWGYWVNEGSAGTTIGGFAPAREEGAAAPPPPMRLSGFNAPWNEAGRQRQQEARAKSGGRKAF